MTLETQADDWQACLLLNIAGGAVVALGTYRFDFYSQTAGLTAHFRSDLKCDKKFSVWDLNGSWGRLSSISFGMGVTFGPMMITAAKHFWSMESFFHSQNVGGFGTGPGGVGGEVLIGRWSYVTTSARKPSDIDNSGMVA
jgi:hypothetical protein